MLIDQDVNTAEPASDSHNTPQAWEGARTLEKPLFMDIGK